MNSIYEDEFKKLFEFLDENKLAVHYHASSRTFTIGGKEGNLRQEIFFCPWTGKKLPDSLSTEFSDLLKSRDLSVLEPECWPEDWRDETWWIKAGF